VANAPNRPTAVAAANFALDMRAPPCYGVSSRRLFTLRRGNVVSVSMRKAIAQLVCSMAVLTLPAGRIPARLSLRQRIGAA